MPSLNKVIIIGNVGSEPEMRFTPNGKPVTSFSVATNWLYTTPDGERKQETEWFSVVAWNRLAEQCNQFLAKGRLVYAEGRLRTRSWEGQDGQQHSRIEVIANRVVFLDKRGAGALTEEKVEETGAIAAEPDEIPY
ncbi:MAG: single-stranded DNA-binding protein [Chloroflexi bacterium]|nr:single-stranded DNA-binding protein [Chloroflexota bacterium]